MLPTYKNNISYFFTIAFLLLSTYMSSAHTPSTTNNEINNGVSINPYIAPAIAPEIKPIISPNIHPTINPNISQTQEVVVQSIINLNLVIELLQKFYAHTSVKVSQFTENVQTLVQKWWRPHEYYEQTRNFIDSNRYYIFLSILTGTYLYCYYKLAKAQNYLASATAWSAWQQRYSTDKLCSSNPDMLGLNLIHDIQMQYTTQANPTDFIAPLVQFLTALQDEINACKHLLAWHTWVAKLHACRLFPRLQCQADALQDRLARLTCVQHIFSHWMAAYNMEHNKKELPRMLPPNSMYRFLKKPIFA